jgi:hypothetical protein
MFGDVKKKDRIMEAKCSNHHPIILRESAWFRGSFNIDGINQFPVNVINSVVLDASKDPRIRIVIGRGPFSVKLLDEQVMWFDHGQEPNPLFTIPGESPLGAGMHMRSVPNEIIAMEHEVMVLIDATVVLTTHDETLIEERQRRLSDELDRIIGVYALYRYATVSSPVLRERYKFYVDLEENGSWKAESERKMDPSQIRNLLHIGDKLSDGELLDPWVVDFRAKPIEPKIQLPLTFFQQALWERNASLRFLFLFWILEFISNLSSNQKTPGMDSRNEFFDILKAFVKSECPQYLDRLNQLGGLIKGAPAKERIRGCLQSFGIERHPDCTDLFLKVRNKISHGSELKPDELDLSISYLWPLTRDVLRKHLENYGYTFFVADG